MTLLSKHNLTIGKGDVLIVNAGRVVLVKEGSILGCTKMYESQNFMMADFQNWLFYPTKPLQKELGFLPKNCGGAQFLKFLAFLEGKTPPKRA